MRMIVQSCDLLEKQPNAMALNVHFKVMSGYKRTNHGNPRGREGVYYNYAQSSLADPSTYPCRC